MSVKTKVILLIVSILIWVVIFACLFTTPTSSSNSSDTRTCSYCDRSFNLSDNRDDFWSIKRTNMCENCYRNYKSLEQFIGQ